MGTYNVLWPTYAYLYEHWYRDVFRSAWLSLLMDNPKVFHWDDRLGHLEWEAKPGNHDTLGLYHKLANRMDDLEKNGPFSRIASMARAEVRRC